MSESVRQRLRQLERVLGVGDVCTCGRVRVSYIDADWLPNIEGEPEPEPERCAVCGRAVPVIEVHYVSDWRGVSVPAR